MAKNRISTSFFENEGHNGRIEASIVDVWSIRSPNTIPMFFEVFFHKNSYQGSQSAGQEK